MKSLIRITILISLILTLASCLSTEVEIDLSNEDTLVLDLTYRMPAGLWELGVFDESSPERAIPVSRRDAEETAVLYDDVTLERYTLAEDKTDVVVRVVYHAGSVESLTKLWGRVAGQTMELSFEDRYVFLPITGGAPVGGYDDEQRDLIVDVFRDREFSVSVVVPGSVTIATFPELSGSVPIGGSGNSHAGWEVPMGTLLTSEGESVLRVDWSGGR